MDVRRLTSTYDDVRRRTSTYVDVCRRTSTYVHVRRRTSTYVDVRPRTSKYVDIRRSTSTYVDVRPRMSTCVDQIFEVNFVATCSLMMSLKRLFFSATSSPTAGGSFSRPALAGLSQLNHCPALFGEAHSWRSSLARQYRI